MDHSRRPPTDFRVETPSSMVQIKNLLLPHPVNAPNVWNQIKEQPASITVSVFFRQGFNSATGADDLSESIHYGKLAKAVRSGHRPSMTSFETLSQIEATVHAMGERSDGRSVVESMVAELHLPKASMTGDEVSFTWVTRMKPSSGSRDELVPVRRLFSIPNMRLMTLVGMNPHEREAKQPVNATLELDYVSINAQQPADCKPFPENGVIEIERTLTAAIETSEYETLELMAQDAIKALSNDFRDKGYGSPTVRLRLEKPKAIAFADAAVVELFVPARDRMAEGSNGATGLDMKVAADELKRENEGLKEEGVAET